MPIGYRLAGDGQFGLGPRNVTQQPAQVLGAQYMDIEREGFYLHGGHNAQLEGLIEEEDYYKDVAHSRDYIYAQWGRFFDVVDIIDSLAANQDLMILRRR